MHTPLLDGGLLNHTKYYFECYRAVTGEQKTIENEEMKQQRQDTKPKKKNSSPKRKPTIKSGKGKRR